MTRLCAGLVASTLLFSCGHYAARRSSSLPDDPGRANCRFVLFYELPEGDLFVTLDHLDWREGAGQPLDVIEALKQSSKDICRLGGNAVVVDRNNLRTLTFGTLILSDPLPERSLPHIDGAVVTGGDAKKPAQLTAALSALADEVTEGVSHMLTGCVLGTDGRVRDCRMRLGPKEAGPPLIAALEKMEFEPAVRDGQPIEAELMWRWWVIP